MLNHLVIPKVYTLLGTDYLINHKVAREKIHDSPTLF